MKDDESFDELLKEFTILKDNNDATVKLLVRNARKQGILMGKFEMVTQLIVSKVMKLMHKRKIDSVVTEKLMYYNLHELQVILSKIDATTSYEDWVKFITLRKEPDKKSYIVYVSNITENMLPIRNNQ